MRVLLSAGPFNGKSDDGSNAFQHGGFCGCPACRAALGGGGGGESLIYDEGPLLGGVAPAFVASGLKWPQPGGLRSPVTITYSYSNLLNGGLGGSLTASELTGAVEEALGEWAQYAPLNFVEVVDSGPAVSDNEYNAAGRPNIRIGHHSDDGRNGILGHAYLPDGSGLAGDVHLDTAESWDINPQFNTIDIIEVMVHELGHSLGLLHEPSNQAIMNATYAGYYDGPGTAFLFQDDINGIRDIYGNGVGSVTAMARIPDASADRFVLEEESVLTVTSSILLNDSDPQGRTLSAEIAAQPAHGDVTLHDDGTFTYTPDANFFGEDSFRYRATNGTFDSAATLVTLVVRPTLDLPIAAPDELTVRAGATLKTGRPSETLIEEGSSWRYLDDGSDQGVAWRATDFDHSGWNAGRAQLGYGEGDEATAVDFGGNPADRHLTTYFRHEFSLADAERVNQFNLRLVRDDGAAVYLNGELILRSNLTANATFDTPALVDIGGVSENRFFSFKIEVDNLPAGTLREGLNVVAVEIHQSRANSDDLGFDLSLAAERGVAPDPVFNDVDADRTGLALELLEPPQHGTLLTEPGGSIQYTPDFGFVGNDSFSYRSVSQTPATLVAAGSPWKYVDSGADLGTGWQGVDFDDSAWDVGVGQLGYGEGDEETSIDFGGNVNQRFATTYFRKEFSVEAPSQVVDVTARLLRDDAAAVYLNGEEVYRDAHLAAGAPFSQYADSEVQNEQEFVEFAIPPELFVAGENVLAVEVHQASPASDDLSFDMELTGTAFSEPTTVTIEVTRLSGDANDDGTVDLNDLNLVRSNFGGDPTVLLGDVNSDGAIDLVDLNEVRNFFGTSATAPQPTEQSTLRVSSFAADTLAPIGSQVQPAVVSSQAWDYALLDWLRIYEGATQKARHARLNA